MDNDADGEDEHEDFLERFNEEFPEGTEIRARLDRTMSYLWDAKVPRGSRLWQTADLLTAIVELDRHLSEEANPMHPRAFAERLRDFYAEVDEVTRVADPDPHAAEHYRRVRSGIYDRISRNQPRRGLPRAHLANAVRPEPAHSVRTSRLRFRVSPMRSQAGRVPVGVGEERNLSSHSPRPCPRL